MTSMYNVYELMQPALGNFKTREFIVILKLQISDHYLATMTSKNSTMISDARILVAILRGDFDKFNAPTIRKDILCFIR